MNVIRASLNAVGPLDAAAAGQAQLRLDGLIKPHGSLGALEEMVVQLAGALQSSDLKLPRKFLVVLSGSPDRGSLPGCGFSHVETAMLSIPGVEKLEICNEEGIVQAIHEGMTVANMKIDAGIQVMAIAQTIIRESAVQRLAEALLSHNHSKTDVWSELITMLACYPVGRPVAILMGIILACAVRRVPVVLDGLVTACAALAAYRLQPNIAKYLISLSLSAYPEHQTIFAELGRRPGLQLNLTEGATVGAILTLSLLDAGVAAYNNMGSFVEAGVSVALQDLNSKQDYQK